MNCPYCNKEMEKGNISVLSQYGEMFWVGDGKRLVDCIRSKEGIIAKHNSFFDGSLNLPCSYCCDCKKIIADVDMIKK